MQETAVDRLFFLSTFFLPSSGCCSAAQRSSDCLLSGLLRSGYEITLTWKYIYKMSCGPYSTIWSRAVFYLNLIYVVTIGKRVLAERLQDVRNPLKGKRGEMQDSFSRQENRFSLSVQIPRLAMHHDVQFM